MIFHFSEDFGDFFIFRQILMIFLIFGLILMTSWYIPVQTLDFEFNFEFDFKFDFEFDFLGNFTNDLTFDYVWEKLGDQFFDQ